MKKYFIASLMLILSIIFFFGCAKDNRQRSLSVNSEDVALLSIFADNGKSESNFLLRNYGHAYLSIENISDKEITVGDMVIGAHENITMGLWNVWEHFGIWYNIESNYIDEYGKYSNRVSLTIGITEEDLSKISAELDDLDNWTPLYNCSSFATEIWNLVAEDNEKINDKLFLSPGYLVEEITKFESYEKARVVTTDKTVRYYKEG